MVEIVGKMSTSGHIIKGSIRNSPRQTPIAIAVTGAKV